jgi:RNA polymerase sigma-54 factor
MSLMPVGPRLEFRQTQTLVMTPQLRQAIKLLQFSNLEVAAFVEEELERNPLLERDDGADTDAAPITLDSPPEPTGLAAPGEEAFRTDQLAEASVLPEPQAAPLDYDAGEQFDLGGPADGVMLHDTGRGGSHSFEADDRPMDDVAENPRSLREHLGEQLRLGFDSPADRLIGAHMILHLDGAGRLAIDLDKLAEALGTTRAHVEAVRARMQRFDPIGLFCTDLRECLAVQLAERNRLDPAMAALLDHLDLLARRDLRRLQQICGVDAEDLAEMIAEIRALDPKPGIAFDSTPPQVVVPDVLMRALPDGSWRLELNPETLPRVLVNQRFHARIVPRVGRADRAFLAEQLSSANWLVRSLQQRAQTILKVAGEIVLQQDAFFRHGVAHMRPLILRDIAEMVEMHESTVSRVTANKFIATPRGTVELKYFFTTAISGTSGETHSAEAVRHRIRALVAAETAADVLSDDAIVAALRREGIDIARRTVAKYRDALKIPSSVQRKREKSASS